MEQLFLVKETMQYKTMKKIRSVEKNKAEKRDQKV